MSINKVIISGNLTRDPELKATAGGISVLELGVAVNERVKNKQTDEWEDRANFVDCTLFGKRAESLKPYLAKGAKVAIEGHLRWSQWEDKDTGKNRSKLSVIVDQVELMQQRQDQAAQPAPTYPAVQYAQPAIQGGYYQAPQAVPYPQPVTAATAVPIFAQPTTEQPVQVATVYDEEIPF